MPGIAGEHRLALELDVRRVHRSSGDRLEEERGIQAEVAGQGEGVGDPHGATADGFEGRRHHGLRLLGSGGQHHESPVLGEVREPEGESSGGDVVGQAGTHGAHANQAAKDQTRSTLGTFGRLMIRRVPRTSVT